MSDPEKLLKPKGYLKSTTSSSGRKYQPKITKVNNKVPVEGLTPEEKFKETPSSKSSTSEPEIKI